MSDENELLEPLATEAGQQAIARAINNLSSLEYAVRAERAATTATQKADEASNSADDASDYATEAMNWATKTDGYVDQETITIPPEQEGDEPTTETIDLYSARYYAALAEETYNNMQFDSEPTENSTKLLSSGTIYTALYGKADKSTTYTKTEVDTQISTAVSNLVNSAPSTLDTLEELANALGDDPNFATTIATQLGNKADKSDTYTKTEVDTALSNVQSTLTFDSTPTANSNNPVTSGGIYTALQNVNIDIDDEITEDSDNPVTSAAIWEALQNIEVTGGAGNASGMQITELYDGNWTTGNITLSDNISNYDLIQFIPSNANNEDERYNHPQIITSDWVIQSSSSKPIELMGEGGRYFAFCYSNDNTLTYKDRSTLGVRKIYGIKFSKNLTEQMYSNVLYENSSGWNNGSITLKDALDNYDFIEFSIKRKIDGPSNTDLFSALYPVSDILGSSTTNSFIVSCYDNLYVSFYQTNKTSLTYVNSRDIGIFKIIGYKLAKGGYSGIVSDARMTVKSGTLTTTSAVADNGQSSYTISFDSPMPDTNYSAIVEVLGGASGASKVYHLIENKTVNGFDLVIFGRGGQLASGLQLNWIAIRPNSYTREGMVEDILFSNASGVKSGTINLSGNISDYDLIQVDVKRPWGNSGLYGCCSQIYKSTDLVALIGANDSIAIWGYDNEYSEFKVSSDSSLLIVNGNKMPFASVTGIKFGRYVSGVAVDNTVTSGSNNVVTSGAVYTALQNYTPSGGGSSITVDSTITQGGTNPVEGGAIYTALEDKADAATTLNGYGITDAYTKTEVNTALANKGDVTTDTNQNITGTKTFVGSKKIAFKQSAANDKLGFTLYSNANAERGYLEFNPTNTVDGVAGLMTLGNYATSAASLTQVGFRRYSNISGESGAYNLLMPMVADARTPFSLTTTYTNFYLPLGFTDGTTTVRTAKSGVVDLSPLLASLEARIAALEGN